MTLARRLAAGGGALLLAIALPACNNDSNTATPGVAIAALTLTATPNPIATVQSSPAGPTWAVRYVANLKETNGLGGTVELVTGSLFDDATGALIARNQFDSADLLVFVGANRVEPKGSLDIPQELTYAAAEKHAASVVVTIRFKDDRGNTIEPTILVKAN